MFDHEFFPTPPKLISLLLAGIGFGAVDNFLEPQAGKGDIAVGVVHGRQLPRFASERAEKRGLK